MLATYCMNNFHLILTFSWQGLQEWVRVRYCTIFVLYNWMRIDKRTDNGTRITKFLTIPIPIDMSAAPFHLHPFYAPVISHFPRWLREKNQFKLPPPFSPFCSCSASSTSPLQLTWSCPTLSWSYSCSTASNPAQKNASKIRAFREKKLSVQNMFRATAAGSIQRKLSTKWICCVNRIFCKSVELNE